MEPVATTAIDLFPSGGFVRLRATGFPNTYVHADEDGVGVSLRPLGDAPSINAVWSIEHCYDERYAAPFILLQGAAYGRYLVTSNQRLPSKRACRVIQRDFNSPNLEVLDPWFLWRPYRQGDDRHIQLSSWGRYLASNYSSFHLRGSPWIVTSLRNVSSPRVIWEVEAVPSSPEPLPLPPAVHAPILVGRLLVPVAHDPDLRRVIRYALANDEGDVDKDPKDWPEFFFHGRSVSNLRTRVRLLLRQDDITLLVRAGSSARPVPLVADLPLNEDPLHIVVYADGSRGAADLKYPKLDQAQPEADDSP